MKIPLCFPEWNEFTNKVCHVQLIIYDIVINYTIDFNNELSFTSWSTIALYEAGNSILLKTKVWLCKKFCAFIYEVPSKNNWSRTSAATWNFSSTTVNDTLIFLFNITNISSQSIETVIPFQLDYWKKMKILECLNLM